MTEILLLGTFHFRESTFDFGSEDVQKQIASLVNGFATFQPDCVAVEFAAHQQALVSKAYETFCLEDLEDAEKVQGGSLGEITMFGETRPIRYQEEAVQVGFRMGKLCALKDIYGIDDDSEIMQDAELLMPYLTEELRELETNTGMSKKDKISDLYKVFNSEQWSQINHNIYIRCNSIQIDQKYTGTGLVAKWYERNLKIFSNIQKLSEKYQRLFIVYGAGHLQILRDLIRADRKLRLVDTESYFS